MGVPLLPVENLITAEKAVLSVIVSVHTVISPVIMKAVVKVVWKKPLAALCSILISSASQLYLRPEAIVVQAGVQQVTLKIAGANLCCLLHISGGHVAFFSG